MSDGGAGVKIRTRGLARDTSARMRAARGRPWIRACGAVTTRHRHRSRLHPGSLLSNAMHGTVRPMPKLLAAALAMAGTLAAGIAGGFAARYAHLPLPWLLGALFTTMILSLAGAPVRLIPWGRPAGTVVVGASTGLQFTTSVLAKLVTLLPPMIG